MKNAIVVVLVVLCCEISSSQTPDTLQPPHRRGKTQLSISLSLQSFSVMSSNSSTSFLVSPRVGLFVSEALQIEPEGVLLLSTGDPAYMLNGNLVYNFPGAQNSVPFLLAGYGIANSIPFFNVPFYSLKMMVGVLNLGVGMKFFLAENVALRAEYRFQSFTGEDQTQSYLGYSYTQKTEARLHSFQFGVLIAP